MKKLLLGALLVVGATSFSVEKPMTGTGAGGTTPFAGSASLTLRAEGSIIDATGKPILVVEPKTVGSGNGSLDFTFNSLVMGGKAQNLEGEFEVRIEETDGTILQFGADTVVDVQLAEKGALAGDTTLDITLTDGLDTSKELGTLRYTLSSGPEGGTLETATSYKGVVLASVTPSTSNTGRFINTDASVEVSVTNFSYNP